MRSPVGSPAVDAGTPGAGNIPGFRRAPRCTCCRYLLVSHLCARDAYRVWRSGGSAPAGAGRLPGNRRRTQDPRGRHHGGCDRGGLGHWGVTRPAMAMLANWCRPDVISSDLHTLSIGTPASRLLVTMASLLASGCRCPQWCGLQRSMPPAPCGLRIVAPCGQEHRPTRIGRGGGRRVPARGCGRRAILGAAASGVARGSARRDVAGITVYPAFAIRYSRRTISISSATDVSAASSS